MINNFVLIVGAMKSGTTSLYNYLSQHPEIAAGHTKEIGFFNHQSRFNKGFDFYQSLWNWQVDVHKYALEASPGYTRVTHPKFINAAANIEQVKQETNANFKFIYLLRNPVDRVESHYTQGLKHNHLSAANLELEKIDSEIIDTSKYGMQIDEYYQRFPAEDILLLNLKDLKQNPQSVLANICQFLEIDQSFQFPGLDICHNTYKNQTSRVMLPGYSKLRNTAAMRDLLKFMPRDMKQSFTKVRNLLARKVDYEYVRLSPSQKEMVLEKLKPDLVKLRDEYQVDIRDWGIEI
ncbi:MAG: sulfotransferase domain-containing protein [Cyanobacteria bacterium J06600_6]